MLDTPQTLSAMTTRELRELMTRADELIQERRVTELQDARTKIAEIASDLGIPITELLTPEKRPARAAAKPKYQSKKDASLTWTGKGRMAAWLTDEMEESGKDKEHFLIT